MLFSRIYPIKRFWCPVDGTIDLGDFGYLRDPETYPDWMELPDSLPFDYIEDVPCLVLLGEPGIGKSEWFSQKKDALRAQVRADGHRYLWVDLKPYDKAQDVVKAVFEHKEFVQWLKGVHPLHLYLDSFDECHSHVSVLPQRLLEELRQYPVERLCLRVMCRTAEWPMAFENGLNKLWGERCGGCNRSSATAVSEENPKVNEAGSLVQLFEMTPLRRRDVEEIVKGEVLDPDSVLKEIESKDLVPFAIKPQTLAFLLKVYQRDGRFPPNQVELYRKGCRELCREPNPERADSGIFREYRTEDRLALACRIAAVTIFGNKLSILRYDVPDNEIKATDISFRDVLHGTESVSGTDVFVGENLLRDTLNTSLFSGRPGNRMGWAHQSYAEFLAAEYLVRNEPPVKQMMTLIQHPHDLEGKIPLQLAETASWLSLMKPEILDELMSVDPEILLLKRREYATTREQHEVRSRLVGSLLKLLDEGTRLDHRISTMSKLGELHHPELADQLQPYIMDLGKNIVVRRVAIRLAEENEVKQLQHAICDVVLNPEDDYLVRKSAALAILSIGDAAVKTRLRPLVLGQAGDDPDDELKGCALMAMWPDHLTAEELFSSLAHPNNPNHVGTYRAFLSGYLMKHVVPSHLPAALSWVRQQSTEDPSVFSFGSLVDSIMVYAWQQSDSPGVLDDFARAALHRLDNYVQIVPTGSKGRDDSILFEDDCKRRCLAQKMIELGSGSPKNARLLAHRVLAVITRGDLSWLIEMFNTLPTGKEQETVARLIGLFFPDTDTKLFEKLFNLSESNEIFREAFRQHTEAVPWDTEEAQGLRRMYEREQATRQSEEGEAETQGLPQATISTFLDQIEQHGASRFIDLAWGMIDAERGSPSFHSLSRGLGQLQAWRDAEEPLKERIIQAAHGYLVHGDPERQQWIGTSITWTAWAGYWALRLMWDEAKETIVNLPDEAWAKWAPAIVACSEPGQDSGARDLIVAAYDKIPEEMISNLVAQIDSESRNSGHLFVLDTFEPCWNERLAHELIAKVQDERLTPRAVESLLRVLLKHGVAEAEDFANAQLELPLPDNERGIGVAIAAGKALMLYAPEKGWSKVWQAIEHDRPFGRRLVTELAQAWDFRLGKGFDPIDEGDLASLYAWISQEFPTGEDPPSKRLSHLVGPRDLGMSILKSLEDRGTAEAVDALRRLQAEIPDQAEDLKWVHAMAKDRYLAMSWTPWSPMEILTAVTNHERRLVQSGHHLLEVVIESLHRFQDSLHDELSAVRDLWDLQHGKPKRWRPVDEDRLSTRIARHLRDDLAKRGIVIGREVKIRPGQFTDIHVDAVTQLERANRLELVRVIIEVKGCWNDGIDKDMEKQLVGRYLTENECDHGLYLVGWFHCDQWDKGHYLRKRPRQEIYKLSVAEAQARFAEQAENVSQSTGKCIKAFVLDAGLRQTAGTSRRQ